MVEVGKTYYFIGHAYYHYVGTVTEANPREVTLKNVVQVHSCDHRSWTEFFRDGFKDGTRYDVVPDGTVVPLGLPYYPWAHKVPTTARRR